MYRTTSIALMLLVGVTLTFGQSDGLDVFGYFQANYINYRPAETPMVLSKLTAYEKNQSTFSLQQLNLFFGKDLGSGFNAFINFEVTNSFSTERNWGEFNLEEAWVKYSWSEALNVKAGLLIPTFNNMNEIKNKTPLLPYILRPLVYETSLSGILRFSNYLPERAFLQVYGVMPVGPVKVDYAFYIGNNETRYVAGKDQSDLPPATDTTANKSYGGRVGLRWSGIKAGISYVMDHEPVDMLGAGLMPRTKLGADLSVNAFGFTFEGEYISVSLDMTAQQKAALSFISALGGPGYPLVGSSSGKSFYYGNLMYDVSDELFGYAGYSYLDNEIDHTLSNGLTATTFGAGYRFSDAVVVKGQYVKYEITDAYKVAAYGNLPITALDLNIYTVAVSVFF